ncbi:hypothetical protein AC578_9358 [Pseudocercospora eumusae]|uniref:SCP domain-containing protein n=1 Tax=Pseudocercospora eumusae TaxID=321146 RepID=A0A139GTW9_9PEZI|nr:hypothetical protein AC578_9358 [Pseudocercospora eumusae]
MPPWFRLFDDGSESSVFPCSISIRSGADCWIHAIFCENSSVGARMMCRHVWHWWHCRKTKEGLTTCLPNQSKTRYPAQYEHAIKGANSNRTPTVALTHALSLTRCLYQALEVTSVEPTPRVESLFCSLHSISLVAMRLTLLIAALLSCTLALPKEDHTDKSSPKSFGHWGHGPPAFGHSSPAAPHWPSHASYHAAPAKQRSDANPWAEAFKQAATAYVANWVSGYANDPYQDRVLKHHNYHRKNHLAEPLVWDQSLAYTAQLVAQTCVYQHNMKFDPGAGQNIAAGYGPDQIGHVITDLFYNNEIPMFQNQWYREPDMTYFEQWGHMTQMCWKATTRVGCATQYCPYGLGNVAGGVQPYFTVCNYKNPGNVATEYAQNLSPPQGAPQINGNSF